MWPLIGRKPRKTYCISIRHWRLKTQTRTILKYFSKSQPNQLVEFPSVYRLIFEFDFSMNDGVIVSFTIQQFRPTSFPRTRLSSTKLNKDRLARILQKMRCHFCLVRGIRRLWRTRDAAKRYNACIILLFFDWISSDFNSREKSILLTHNSCYNSYYNSVNTIALNIR